MPGELERTLKTLAASGFLLQFRAGTRPALTVELWHKDHERTRHTVALNPTEESSWPASLYDGYTELLKHLPTPGSGGGVTLG